jgi:PAS domain S-box-containing protein
MVELSGRATSSIRPFDLVNAGLCNDMPIDAWVTVLLVLVPTAAALWLARQTFHLRERLRRLSQTARSKHQHYQDLECRHQDQTDFRQRTEENLRGYLRLMDTLINTIPNPIYFKDEADIFRGCNQAFARDIVGLTRDRIIGRKAEDLGARVPAELVASLQRKGGEHAGFEAEIPCADGRKRDYLFSLAQVGQPGHETAGSVGVMQDLTAKNRAARDRAQKEKFQGVLETAGAVCHELNQPLQVISGYAELMMVEVKEGDVPHQLAEQILEQVERIADITGKLQKITRYKTVEYGRHAKIFDIHQASDE